MSNYLEEASRRAEEDYRRNREAQMAEEQRIRDYVERERYNAEIARQRQLEADRQREEQRRADEAYRQRHGG